MRKVILGAAAGAALIFVSAAGAAITPASCENGGGNLPPGQQPVCSGEGLEQNPATNPAGHAPPGQQP